MAILRTSKGSKVKFFLRCLARLSFVVSAGRYRVLRSTAELGSGGCRSWVSINFGLACYCWWYKFLDSQGPSEAMVMKWVVSFLPLETGMPALPEITRMWELTESRLWSRSTELKWGCCSQVKVSGRLAELLRDFSFSLSVPWRAQSSNMNKSNSSAYLFTVYSRKNSMRNVEVCSENF